MLPAAGRRRLAGGHPARLLRGPALDLDLPTLVLLRDWPRLREHGCTRDDRAGGGTAGGSTTGRGSSTARSSRASTAGPSPIGAYFGAEVDGLVAACSPDQARGRGAGTARPRTARRCRRSTRRSACSRACSTTSCRGEAVAAARRGGEDYLLERRLFRRRSTGEVPAERWLHLLAAALALRRPARPGPLPPHRRRPGRARRR